MAFSSWQTWIPLMDEFHTPWLYPLAKLPTAPDGPEIHYDVAAGSKAQASYAHMVTLSALAYAIEPKPFFMTFGQGATPGAPFDVTQTGTTLNIHSGWFGEAMKERFPDAILASTSADPTKWLPSQDMVLAGGIDPVAEAILDFFEAQTTPVPAGALTKR
jgi:hypothetical protein